jgi:hypothetical protein
VLLCSGQPVCAVGRQPPPPAGTIAGRAPLAPAALSALHLARRRRMRLARAGAAASPRRRATPGGSHQPLFGLCGDSCCRQRQRAPAAAGRLRGEGGSLGPCFAPSRPASTCCWPMQRHVPDALRPSIADTTSCQICEHVNTHHTLRSADCATTCRRQSYVITCPG